MLMLSPTQKAGPPDEPRDDHGRWTTGGASTGHPPVDDAIERARALIAARLPGAPQIAVEIAERLRGQDILATKSNKAIYLNPIVTDPAALDRIARDWSGLRIGGGTLESTIVHEMGHVLITRLLNSDEPTYRRLEAFARQSVPYGEKTAERWELETHAGRSVYSQEHLIEWEAESFADWIYHGAQASESGRFVGAILSEVYGRVRKGSTLLDELKRDAVANLTAALEDEDAALKAEAERQRAFTPLDLPGEDVPRPTLGPDGEIEETVTKDNPYHEPAGSPVGGQFAHAPEGGTPGERPHELGLIRLGQQFALAHTTYGHLTPGRLKQDVSEEVQRRLLNRFTQAQVDTAWEKVHVVSTITGRGDQANEYDVSKGIVDRWAGTSADTDPVSVGIQLAVHHEFGLADAMTDDMTAGLKDVLALEETARANAVANDPVVRAALRAQYDATQAWFAEHHITHLTLYRGMLTPYRNMRDKTTRGIDVHEESITLHPLSSFTTSLETATLFADYGPQSLVMEINVPVSRVFSTPFTGNGCFHEHEIVVLGGKLNARVVSTYDPKALGGSQIAVREVHDRVRNAFSRR